MYVIVPLNCLTDIKPTKAFDKIKSIFSNALHTYFPAYRYETPAYLTDSYKHELRFKVDSDIIGYLSNPIEVTSDLPQIANWVMDIVLDSNLYPKSNESIHKKFLTKVKELRNKIAKNGIIDEKVYDIVNDADGAPLSPCQRMIPQQKY